MQYLSVVPARLRVALAALCCVVVISLGPAPAAAQFVCDSTTPGGAAGALVGTGGVACGTNANATGSDSSNTAVGQGADSRGGQSVNTAVGFQADASTNVSNDSANTALGANAHARGDGSTNIAIGSANVTQGLASPNAGGNLSSNFAAGNGANASGSGSLDTLAANIAIGFNANASGNETSNLAIGANSTASSNSVAYGAGASATGANSSAIGTGAQATFANSAAFGTGATTTRADQQVFGTASNTYTMSGIASSASRAAQSGPVQIVTSDAGGNLATASPSSLGLASMGDIANINSRIDDLTTRSNKAFTGVAMAFAMAGVPTLLPSETFAATMNWGTFQGTNGMALNAAFRVGPNLQVNGGVGYGPNERIAGGRVGVRIGW